MIKIHSIMIVSLDDYMCTASSAVMAISKFEFVPSSRFSHPIVSVTSYFGSGLAPCCLLSV